MDRYDLIRTIIKNTGKVTAAMLAKDAKISRQAAGKCLDTYAKRGQLKRMGSLRAKRYVEPDPTATRRLDDHWFWKPFLEAFPHIFYVELGRFGVELRVRSQVKNVLAGIEYLNHQFVFLDFHGVEDATESFLDELLYVWPQWGGAMLHPINTSPELRKKIARIYVHRQQAGPADVED